jgi:biotin transport system substrate-specific component
MSRFLPILLATGALVAVSPVAIPIGEVPITLQSAVVCFAGLTLGLGRTLVAVLLYLGLGAVGLPVFAGNTGGLDVVRGPTGGYLVGFAAALPALGLGRLIFSDDRAVVQASLAALFGHLAILALGVFWLHEVLVWTWYRTLEAGLWPFLPGALGKSVLVGLLVAWVTRKGEAAPIKRRGR